MTEFVEKGGEGVNPKQDLQYCKDMRGGKWLAIRKVKFLLIFFERRGLRG